MMSDTAVLLRWVFPRADVVEGGWVGRWVSPSKVRRTVG